CRSRGGTQRSAGPGHTGPEDRSDEAPIGRVDDAIPIVIHLRVVWVRALEHPLEGDLVRAVCIPVLVVVGIADPAESIAIVVPCALRMRGGNRLAVILEVQDSIAVVIAQIIVLPRWSRCDTARAREMASESE